MPAAKLFLFATVASQAAAWVLPTPPRATRVVVYDKLPTKGLGAFIERAGSIDPTRPRYSPASEMRMRAAARKAGKPLPPMKRGGEVPDFLKNSDPEANLLQQKIGFVVLGLAFLGLEAKQLVKPEIPFNYSCNNDAFCVKQRELGVKSEVCGEFNMGATMLKEKAAKKL